MWETWVQSLGCEDPLEKGKATHSSILAWRIPWTQSMGVTKSQTQLSDFHFHFFGKIALICIRCLKFQSSFLLLHQYKYQQKTNDEFIITKKVLTS